MTDVFPLIDGFVGYGNGAEALLRSDEAWDSEHPLVKERPELFTAPEPAAPARRGPGRSPKATPKAGAVDG